MDRRRKTQHLDSRLVKQLADHMRVLLLMPWRVFHVRVLEVRYEPIAQKRSVY